MQPPPPPHPPLVAPPPLSETAMEILRQKEEDAKPRPFQPFSLSTPTRSYPKSKLPQSSPSVALPDVLRQHFHYKGKGLQKIAKEHLLIDKPLAYARESMKHADSRIPYGTYKTLSASASSAHPLTDPFTIVLPPPKPKKGGKKSHKKSHKKGGKKSHKKSHKKGGKKSHKKSHRRRH